MAALALIYALPTQLTFWPFINSILLWKNSCVVVHWKVYPHWKVLRHDWIFLFRSETGFGVYHSDGHENMTKKEKQQSGGESEDIGGFEDFGIDIQEAVKQRLAHKNKKTVQLNDLLADTKFTKSEIRTMYRGFKQVRSRYYFWPSLTISKHCGVTLPLK